MANVYLSELINHEDVLDAAFAQPGMKIKPRSKKVPTLEMATKAVLVEIEKAVIAHVVEDMEPKLQDVLDEHIMLYGELADAEGTEAKEEWTNTVDEAVEAAITTYTPVLSQSWLGEHTIDCGLHEVDGVAKFAHSLGKEYYKQLTYGKGKSETGKILSNAGILNDAIQARLDIHINPTEEEKETMATEQDADLQTVYAKIAEHIGQDHDAMAVYDDLDLALEDDDGLAFGAGVRLGITEAEVETLRLVSFEHGKDAVDIAQQAIQAILDGAAPVAKKAKATKPKAPKPEAARKDAKAITAARADAEVMEPSVLIAVKELGAGDTETSKGIGTSRQTYTSYVTGKTDFKPTEDQKAYIRGILVDKANMALEAIASLDGTEAETIF